MLQFQGTFYQGFMDLSVGHRWSTSATYDNRLLL